MVNISSPQKPLFWIRRSSATPFWHGVAASRADILLPQVESLRPQRSAPADALDKLDTLTARWKCATLKGTLGRFVDGKVPRGPHNFLTYQGRRMRRRRGRG
jgi:hypothetical protein